MSKKLRSLLDRKQKKVAAARAISNKAETESRDMSVEEQAEFDGLISEAESLGADIQREQALIAAEANLDGIDISADAVITGGAETRERDPKRGFKSFGEFAMSVRAACEHGGRRDPRLSPAAAAPNTYGNEGSGQDGGYVIPPEFSTQILSRSYGDDDVLQLTDNNPIGGNSMVYPRDETTPWGASGVKAYWRKEAGNPIYSKPSIETSAMRLNELFAIVAMTNELLEDAPALGAYLDNQLPISIRWKRTEAFFRGDGVGMPLGFENSGALVTVDKEAGQAADSIVVKNIAKMFARMPAASLSRAVWLINSDILPELISLQIGNTPIWTPPGGLPNAPAGAILGRPIMSTEHARTLGDKGDISFVDWKAYRTITKASGIQTDSSVHLFFDVNLTAFRAIFRVDGRPTFSKPQEVANGAATKSPFIQLADRA